MPAETRILYQSGFYRITDYRCDCDRCSVTAPEYNEAFCMSFIRKGFFEYRVFRCQYELHAGRVLLSKPGYEHRTRHIDHQPDLTSVFEFTVPFFRELQEQYDGIAGAFLNDPEWHAFMLASNSAMDFAHQHLWRLVHSGQATLQVDEAVMELLDRVLRSLESKPPAALPERLKAYHLPTVEKAREYIFRHFKQDITLQQLATHCCISPFHFSRIFKMVLHVSPHQYLVSVRLQQARILLTTSNRPISDIAFEVGFNSAEHFAAAYRRYFKQSPSQQRLVAG